MLVVATVALLVGLSDAVSDDLTASMQAGMKGPKSVVAKGGYWEKPTAERSVLMRDCSRGSPEVEQMASSLAWH